MISSRNNVHSINLLLYVNLLNLGCFNIKKQYDSKIVKEELSNFVEWVCYNCLGGILCITNIKN